MDSFHEILGCLLEKHVIIALPGVVDIRIMEEGFEVVEGWISMTSEDCSCGLCCGGTVPADPCLCTGWDCVEFGRVLKVAQDVWVLEVSFGKVETRWDLDKDLCDFRDKSVFGEGVIYDDDLIGLLCILELFPIASISQCYCSCLECSYVGDEGHRSSSSGKRTHMKSKPSITVLYLRNIISTLIDVT